MVGSRQGAAGGQGPGQGPLTDTTGTAAVDLTVAVRGPPATDRFAEFRTLRPNCSNRALKLKPSANPARFTLATEQRYEPPRGSGPKTWRWQKYTSGFTEFKETLMQLQRLKVLSYFRKGCCHDLDNCSIIICTLIDWLLCVSSRWRLNLSTSVTRRHYHRLSIYH